MPRAGVVPGQAHHAGAVQRRQKGVADAAVQHAPHVVAVLVEVGQLEDVQHPDRVPQGHDRHPGKVDAAELQLLDDRRLVPRHRVGVDVDDDAPVGALLHQLGEALRAQRGGVAGGLVLGIGEYILRDRLGRGGMLQRTARQHSGIQRRGGQHRRRSAFSLFIRPVHAVLTSMSVVFILPDLAAAVNRNAQRSPGRGPGEAVRGGS